MGASPESPPCPGFALLSPFQGQAVCDLAPFPNPALLFHNHRTSDLMWRVVLTTEQATNPRTDRGYEMSRSWLVCMGVHLRLWTCMCACICSQVLNCFPLGPVSCTLRCPLPPPSFTPVAPVALTHAPPSGPFPHPFFTPKSLPFAVPPPEAFL